MLGAHSVPSCLNREPLEFRHCLSYLPQNNEGYIDLMTRICPCGTRILSGNILWRHPCHRWGIHVCVNHHFRLKEEWKDQPAIFFFLRVCNINVEGLGYWTASCFQYFQGSFRAILILCADITWYKQIAGLTYLRKIATLKSFLIALFTRRWPKSPFNWLKYCTETHPLQYTTTLPWRNIYWTQCVDSPIFTQVVQYFSRYVEKSTPLQP